ncbi:tectonic-like complex member MKS1 isoform X2 [Procambarus clarkii]|uniref:tectonic-like complex member MKS1 isoform X2 n=1 Tax=Procambarus clarkii TaxID=6728 RepID=UPI003744A12A
MEPSRDQCAYYYTKDQINNLQIRVCLQQLTGTQLVDVSPRVVEDTSGVREAEIALAALSIPSNDATVSHTHQQVIKWQQKLLSAFETVEYSRTLYANDKKYKMLYEQAMKLKKKKQGKQRIFTYIHQNKFHYQVQDAVSTSKRQDQECWLRQRKTTTSIKKGKKDNNTDENEGIEEVNRKRSKNQELTQSPQQQYFYIMADLAPPDSLGESRSHEVVLCTLRYDAQGQLMVSPDFTKPTSKAYRLESFGSDNALYEYTIENISLCHSAEEKHHEDQLVKQITEQRLEEIEQMVGLEWDTQQLEVGELHLLVVGEIMRALHFSEAFSLYIHFVLHLPPGQGWPILLLAAFSVDWLGQDRDEGYAAFRLSTTENVANDCCREDMVSKVHSVATWRPAQLSPLSLMRRFFIGGCQLMADPSYLAVGSNTEMKRVSRLGFSTLSSGILELRTNTVIQGDLSETDFTSQMENQSGWQLSTVAVIDAFNKSRQKLRAAKQGLL